MPFTESDMHFLQQANRVIEEPLIFRPHIIDDVNRLKAKGLGAGIYARFELSAKPLLENILVGVAIPLPPDNDGRHLVILISGDMAVVRPQDKTSTEVYDNFFSNGIYFTKSKSIRQLANFNNSHIGAQMILRNDTEAGREYIDDLVPVALDFAKTLKQSRG